MVDKNQIEQAFFGETLESIRDSLETLAKTGFWQVLIRANQFRIANGFDSDSEEVLARQIREVRAENKVLLTLESLYPPQTKE